MIEINNLTTIQVDEDSIKEIIQLVLQGEGIKKEIELSVAFVGQGRIREVNKRYRGKNRATDVLSFPESKVLMEKFKIGPTEKIPGLGEMIICLREVKKNAKKTELAFEKELAKIVIHGALHLLGYDHEKSEQEEVKMQKKENYYLSQVEFK